MPPRVTLSCSNLTRKQSCVAQFQHHLTMRRQQAPSRQRSDGITNNDNHSGTSLSLLNTPTSPRNLSRDDDYLLHEQSMKRTTRQSFNEHYLTGWRIGALLSLIGAVFVSVFNLVITIWVWRNPQKEIEGAVGTLYRGNCAKVRSLNIWIHLLVNVRFARPNTSITTLTVTSGPLYAAACGFQLLHASS
jgi:hypothetical protein